MSSFGSEQRGLRKGMLRRARAEGRHSARLSPSFGPLPDTRVSAPQASRHLPEHVAALAAPAGGACRQLPMTTPLR